MTTETRTKTYRWRTSTSAPVNLQCHIALHR